MTPGFVAPAQASIPRPRRYVRPGPDAAARVETNPSAAPFDALSEKLARMGAVDPTEPPKGSVSKAETEPFKGSLKGSDAGSGTGTELPELQNLLWEPNAKGGWEAWHVPDGAQQRRDKTYLGYVGKRQLAAWQELSPAEFHHVVCDWVERKRAEKL